MDVAAGFRTIRGPSKASASPADGSTRSAAWVVGHRKTSGRLHAEMQDLGLPGHFCALVDTTKAATIAITECERCTRILLARPLHNAESARLILGRAAAAGMHRFANSGSWESACHRRPPRAAGKRGTDCRPSVDVCDCARARARRERGRPGYSTPGSAARPRATLGSSRARPIRWRAC